MERSAARRAEMAEAWGWGWGSGEGEGVVVWVRVRGVRRRRRRRGVRVVGGSMLEREVDVVVMVMGVCQV